ncbi:hypothetical protein J5X84_33020 [Streptosporangiaceae bacterium NEAU-GS5]|nr:hypothetical protein [Streptosporangiaceae bacterium NEAU-GS5]
MSPAAAALDKLLGDLYDAEDMWRYLNHWEGRPTGPASPRGAHARTKTISWLAQHLTGMLTHPRFVDLPTTIYRWERVLRHLNRDDRAANSSPIRCKCGERRYSWDDQRHHYRCGNCENVLYQNEHDEHARLQAEALAAAQELEPQPPAVPHQALHPATGDDTESRAAGPRDLVTQPIRIDPDTLLLTLDVRYARPLDVDEIDDLPWPTCPKPTKAEETKEGEEAPPCGAPIYVDGHTEVIPGKPAMAYGPAVLAAIPDQHVFTLER